MGQEEPSQALIFKGFISIFQNDLLYRGKVWGGRTLGRTGSGVKGKG